MPNDSSLKISLVRAWLNSSLSIQEFCDSHNLSATCFTNWVQKYRTQASKRGKYAAPRHMGGRCRLRIYQIPPEIVLQALANESDE